MDLDLSKLAPPAVSSLRAQAIGTAMMERSLSENIKEERKELREAAERTLNVIVDLNLDGSIKWVSPSWVDVIGTQPSTVQGAPIADLVISEDKTAFSRAVDSMKKDDSRSQYIRFTVCLGPMSKLYPATALTGPETGGVEPITIELEAQGIMVYDRATGGESHTMWMIRPWVAPREIKIDLPPLIVESLGSGAEILASYLTQLAESGQDEPVNQPPTPTPVLCRICERQIPPWWFEKHTELCLQEHQAEMDVQMAQESLTEHRHAIVKVLDTLEARKSRQLSDLTALPIAEYKGQPIGPSSSTSSPGGASPTPSSRDRSTGFGHSRSRSFAVRRPQARIVELLLDLCDTAMEISPPAIKESASQNSGELRTQSPQSESRISQVLQWQSPGSNTVEQEQGLALLCADTEKVAKGKVEAVFRHRRIIEYSERIRIEFAVRVQDCIDEAMHKAARIAAGLSDSTEDEELEEGDEVLEEEMGPEPLVEEPVQDEPPETTALTLALNDMGLDDKRRRLSSAIESTRSSSPRECPTPKSHRDALGVLGYPRDSRRGSMLVESDAGDSDGSARSASAASRQPPRTDSPISEFGGLRRGGSSRQHNRRSLILTGTASPRRQESPSRGTQPSSPLRISKPRNLHFNQEGIASPEASPMLSHGDFSSPAMIPHHRRQSSTVFPDFNRPSSPRLNPTNAPPLARAVPPSIKDFEIIKPISKGAFGSVYLSKKKSTGEYFAIKVLKKADMVAKNQVTNVKAERAIMMWQGESDFVAKLYWTFSSKDYLYLVMEYLNGGDCASLVRVLGGLPEDWVKRYLGEVILGVEHLHSRGIIHRDLKPDNLLIDQKGHLKLTDFGLSRMGLIGRQKRALNSGPSDKPPDLLKSGPFVRSTSVGSSRSTSMDLQGSHHSPSATPQIFPDSSLGQPSYFSLSRVSQEPRRISGQRSDSGGSETLPHMLLNFSLNDVSSTQPIQTSIRSSHDEVSEIDSPDLLSLHQTNSQTSETHRTTPPQSSMMPPPMALFDPEDTNRRFVGTPDYLAPETISGGLQDQSSDWWSVGCIMFEFLYGFPPFHASEAEQVFENILARRIEWPEDDGTVSPEAKDLINRLLCVDPQKRLGNNQDDKFASGGEEIRNHPWFIGTNWDTLLQDEAQFVPQPENPEDTEYFDSRGATLQSFTEEIEDQVSVPSSSTPDYPDRPHDALSRPRSQIQVTQVKRGLMPLHIPPHIRDLKSRRSSEPVASDDFGSFTFKNLTVLEKANKDVIQQLKAQAMAAQNRAVVSPSSSHSAPTAFPPLEGSPVMPMPIPKNLSNAKASASQRPSSPSTASHANSSPSRVSQPSSPLLVSFHAGSAPDGRRKVSGNASSSFSLQSGTGPLQPGSFDVPKTIPNLQKSASAVAASPARSKGAPAPLAISPQQKSITTPRHASGSSTRSRSLTVGSQDGSPIAPDLLAHHRNRRSQVFDMSPSSSDNEGGERANALLKVQRRRQSSRRMSAIMLDSPTFRSLDVLICEDHPVARMIMEKLLEKLRCRTICASTGSDAVRYAVGEVKFDIIFTEFKLPGISGSDVARMVREVKNVNAHTPIVAITAYLKELQAPHYFDSLIEKPISSSKLIEVISNLCQWKPPAANQSQPIAIPNPISAIKPISARLEDSPTSGSSGYARPGSSSFHGSSREDSISSSLFGDSESVITDDIPIVLSRKATGDWGDEAGSSLNADEIVSSSASRLPITLVSQHSSPAQLEGTKTLGSYQSLEKLKSRREHLERRRHEGSESADDEDEEAANSRERGMRLKPLPPSSKLGIEMMRANSHDSVAMTSDSTLEPATKAITTLRQTEGPPTARAGSSRLVSQITREATRALESTAVGQNPREEATNIQASTNDDSTSALGSSDANQTPRPTMSAHTSSGDEPTPRATLKSSGSDCFLMKMK